jgi:hypothetical protein
MVDGKEQEILEDLNLEDDESIGLLSFEKIMRYWNYSGYPKLDEELIEFLQQMAIHIGNSLNEIDYKAFCKVFDPEFIMGPSCIEDDAPFVPSEHDDAQYLALEMVEAKSPAFATINSIN